MGVMKEASKQRWPHRDWCEGHAGQGNGEGCVGNHNWHHGDAMEGSASHLMSGMCSGIVLCSTTQASGFEGVLSFRIGVPGCNVLNYCSVQKRKEEKGGIFSSFLFPI